MSARGRLLAVLVTAFTAAAGPDPTPTPAPTPAPRVSLLERLLRVTGLVAAPSQLRGPPASAVTGEIWIAEACGGGAARRLTPGAGYRSPVFSPGDGAIFALRGDAVVRVSPEGVARDVLAGVKGLQKLVGFDRQRPDDLIVLTDGPAPIAVLSLARGEVTPLPYDPSSAEQQRMLAQVRGEERVVDSTRVYVMDETREGLARRVSWTDVHVRCGDTPPANVTQGDGVSSAQPALSPDGRRLAFLRAAP